MTLSERKKMSNIKHLQKEINALHDAMHPHIKKIKCLLFINKSFSLRFTQSRKSVAYLIADKLAKTKRGIM